jgi:perosamine synthetase
MMPQYEPLIDAEDVSKEIDKYLKAGGWITEHKKTRELEKVIADFLGVKHCSIVSNGTISLSIALLAAGVGPGDEVLVPDLTMIATANAVKLIGAKPVFVDIRADNLGLDLIEATYKKTNKTKALIYVSLNGRTHHQGDIKEFCNLYNLIFIGDDAQSLGSEWDGKIGTKSDIASFSFSMPKIITTGQGGCLVTNNDEYADKIKKIRDFGREKSGVDKHIEFGINAKFTDLQAIVGLSQFKNIEGRIKRKKEIFALYRTLLLKIPEVKMIETHLEYCCPWFVDCMLENRETKLALAEFLKLKGVGTRPVYPPVHTQAPYFEDNSYPVAQEYSERGLWLPSSLTLKDDDIIHICHYIKEFFNNGK